MSPPPRPLAATLHPKLHVGGDERHEVALVAALQLGGRKAPQRRKHPVAHEREDAEGQVVVAQLLAIAQGATHYAAYAERHSGYPGGDRLRQSGEIKERIGSEHGEEDGRRKAHDAQHHGKRHDRQKRPRELHEAQHDGEMRAMGSGGCGVCGVCARG